MYQLSLDEARNMVVSWWDKLDRKIRGLFSDKRYYLIFLNSRPSYNVVVTKSWQPFTPFKLVAKIPGQPEHTFHFNELKEAKEFAHRYVSPEGSGSIVDDTVVPL